MKIRSKSVWGNKRPVGSGFSRTFTFSRTCIALSIAFFLLSAAPLWAQPRARLSDSLQKHVASKSAGSIDVIVHGSADEVNAIAARHGLRITKKMLEGAVLQASAAQIDALSAEIDHLSRDVEVTSFMSVTNQAVGADQVWAGVAGHHGLTGAGIGVARQDPVGRRLL